MALNVARVMKHIVEKGVQAGGVLGVGLVAPLVLAAHKHRGGDAKDAVPKVATALAATTATTVALGGALLLSDAADAAVGLPSRVCACSEAHAVAPARLSCSGTGHAAAGHQR